MDKIISAYNSAAPGADGHIELEASINLPIDMFMSAIERQMASAAASGEAVSATTSGEASKELTTTIDFIVPNARERTAPRKIRTVHFVAGVKTLDSYGTKQHVSTVTMSDPIAYKVKVSVEKPSAPFSIPRDSLVRFKTRMSFTQGNFRTDFTLVRQERFDACDLKAMRDQLFPPGMKSITPNMDLSQYTSHEIEIEFIGKNFLAEHYAELCERVSAIAGGSTNAIALAAAEIVVRPDRLDKFRRGELSFKHLAPQVVALSRQEYIGIFPPVGWFVTPKYDGVRAFIMNTDGVLYIIGATVESRPSSIHDIILVDCEIINGVAYVFDVMMCGINVADRPYESRQELIGTAVEKLSAVFECRAKPLLRLTENYAAELQSIWKPDESPIPLDGIIFVASGDGYMNTRSYKWKPLSHNTIDFYVVECPKTLLGIKPYMPMEGLTLYLLFVGISYHMLESLGLNRMPQYRDIFPRVDQNYFPIQFSPSSNPLAYLWWSDRADLARKVVELRLDVTSGNAGNAGNAADTGIADNADNNNNNNVTNGANWKFVRVRDDRVGEVNYWGNDFRVAELTYLNYIDVFEFRDLITPGGGVYFSKMVGNAYKAANAYKRFVISQFIEKYASGKIMDLMCGRGADIFRYEAAGVREVLAMDIDPAAIAEMLRRKLSPRKREVHPMKKYAGNDRFREHRSHALVIHAQVADMRAPPDILTTMAEKFGYYPGVVDFAVSNFAIHYLCDDSKHLRGFLIFVARMLKIGGYFMFTTFDGARVFNLLGDTDSGSTYEFMENGQPKYAIKKLYLSDKLATNGQMISVKLPFAEVMVDEPLANIAAVIGAAKKLGFAQEHVGGFAEWESAFGRLKSDLVSRLTDVDRQYIALHTVVVLKLTKRVASTK